MIKYALNCSKGHVFDAWFRSSDAYDKQARRHLVTCPDCGCKNIEKQVMAPALLKRGRKDPAPAPVIPRETGKDAGASQPPLELLRAFKQHVIANTEDVGSRFADEALRMHYGDAEARAIRGETTGEEAIKLQEEGVAFGVLPVLPEERN